MFPHAIHHFDFYLFILHLFKVVDACFLKISNIKKSNHSQSIMAKITFLPSVCQRHPTIAIKDQTITIPSTSRSDFCCSRLATGLAVRELSTFFLQLNGGLNLKIFAKWISSSSTRQRSAFQFHFRHQIMMDTFLLFCFQSSRRLAENPEKLIFFQLDCLPFVEWLNGFSELLNIVLFHLILLCLGLKSLLKSINWNYFLQSNDCCRDDFMVV